MKVLRNLYLLMLIFVCAACNDPYEGDTFTIYDVQPASSYLSSRPEDFSEWVAIMKYADLYNAVNQATQNFTVFAPNNKAVKEFYAKQGVSSIEELGQEYAKTLVKYHIIQDTINQEMFIENAGKLDKKTLSDDYISVSFEDGEGEAGGLQSVYLNKEAHVIEFANKVSNGYVYVLEDAMTPLTQSVYERMTESGRPYTLFAKAMEATGWKDSVNIIYKDVVNGDGEIVQQKCEYTLLGVTDATYQQAGINTVEDLAAKLGAGSDYTSLSNALNQYVAYHIIPSAADLNALMSFDTQEATSKMWNTKNKEGLITISKEEDEVFYLNYNDENSRCTLVEDECDLQAKNGYIHQLSGYMPVAEPEPVTVLFDPCDNQEIKNWIEAGNGETGIKYQTIGSAEYKCDISMLNTFKYKLSSPGGKYSSYYNVTYFTVKSNSNWKVANKADMLMLNLGNTGWIEMTTPTILKGKYKVTLQFGYATSMNFIREGSSGSNGGQMKFTFDGENQVITKPYMTVPANTLDCYQAVIYDEIEFDSTSEHVFKLVMDDPAASTNSSYRIMIDYILFEPITE